MHEQASRVTATTAAVDEIVVAEGANAAAIGKLRHEAKSVSEDVTKLSTAGFEVDQQLKLIDQTTHNFLDLNGNWAR